MAHWPNDYFRLAPDWTSSAVSGTAAGQPGFFRFGSRTICFGRSETGAVAKTAGADLYDVSKDVTFDGCKVRLPIDPSEVIDNLHLERYQNEVRPAWERMVGNELIRLSYYFVRELLPVAVRRHLQRVYFNGWKKLPFPSWPVDFTVDAFQRDLLRLTMQARGVQRVPFIWFWPEGAPNCLIMTHDVEGPAGRDFTSQLMDLDESYGFKASFQVIPEKRYEISADYVEEIRSRGFEFNIHDLNHDGHLYAEREEFLRRAKRINGYVHRFHSNGFRAGAMYRNADWYDAFEFSYDMSVPSVAHLEPKRGGCCTVMPFFIGNIVELPLTMTQDYSLFHILKDYSLDLWKAQLDLVRQENGLISFIAHPDYLITRREREVYESLLSYLQGLVAREKIWAPLPGDVDRWWRDRSRMELAPCGNGWKINGPSSERARIAYAVLENGQLKYEMN